VANQKIRLESRAFLKIASINRNGRVNKQFLIIFFKDTGK
jgi:hypothetical protein